MSALPRLFAVFVPLAGLTTTLVAQESDSGGSLIIQDSPSSLSEPVSSAPVIAPMKLEIARRDLRNFLLDEEALAPYRSGEGLAESLSDVFVIGSHGVPRAIFWDPLACRLLGVLDLDAPVPPAETPKVAEETDQADPDEDAPEQETPPAAPPSPYLMLAAGPAPLSGSVGSRGTPRYFGFRLVAGMPEFLYTVGALTIEERLWLEDEGRVLKQRFSVREAPQGIRLTFPEAWKPRLSAAVGTWKENVLTVSPEESGEVILTYQLTDAAPESAASTESSASQ